jgi:hypothetical protein
MSQRCVESVLGRLITDAVFRQVFFEEPEAVCREHALELTPTELSALLQIHAEGLEGTAAGLDPRIVRAVIAGPPEGRRTGAALLQPQKRRKQGAP